MIIKITSIIKDTIKNFIVNFKSMIVFEMLYKLLVISLFIPLTNYIVSSTLAVLGEFTIANTEIAKELLNTPIIIAIICIILISFVGTFIEVATIIFIANESRQNRKVNYIKGIINSIKILKKSKSIYIIPMVLLLGIIGPITRIGISTSLIKDIKIPGFIKGEIFKLTYGKIAFNIAILALILLLSRWIYSIIAMDLEDITLKKSFKHSKKINKNSKGKTICYLFLWSLFDFVIKIILFTAYFIFIYVLLTIVGNTSSTAEIIFYIAIVVFLLGYSFISVITIPLFITFLLELYYKYKNYDVNLRKNKLDINLSIFKMNVKNKRIFNILIIALFIVSVFTMTITNLVSEYSSNVKVSAHRGSSLRAPENSMISIEYAVQEQADYVEIDAMTTKDNKVVLFHDTTLKRIANSNRKIKDMTLEEVKKVDNGSYFDEKFKDQRIPTLEDVFKAFKGKIKFNIELKPTRADDKLVEEVANLIKKYNMEDEVIVSSLDKDTIQRFESENSEIFSGYIISFAIGDLNMINVDFISVEYELISASLVELFHMYGREVHVWTLNDKDKIIRAASLGVDNIITDNVFLAKETLYKSKYRDIIFSFLFNMQGISYTEEEYENYGEYIDYIVSNMNYGTWFKDIIRDIIMYVKI